MRKALALSWVLALVAVGGCPASPVVATDLEGRDVAPLADGQPTVLLFVRTDCPISNRYTPTIQTLLERYDGRVKFYSVFVAPREDAASVRAHMREFKLETSPLLDPDHRLVALTGSTVTPEAAVFDARGKLAYRGRIDNRFVSLGKARPRATVHDLADAIDAVLRRVPVARPRVPAVGCYIRDAKA